MSEEGEESSGGSKSRFPGTGNSTQEVAQLMRVHLGTGYCSRYHTQETGIIIFLIFSKKWHMFFPHGFPTGKCVSYCYKREPSHCVCVCVYFERAIGPE